LQLRLVVEDALCSIPFEAEKWANFFKIGRNSSANFEPEKHGPKEQRSVPVSECAVGQAENGEKMTGMRERGPLVAGKRRHCTQRETRSGCIGAAWWPFPFGHSYPNRVRVSILVAISAR